MRQGAHARVRTRDPICYICPSRHAAMFSHARRHTKAPLCAGMPLMLGNGGCGGGSRQRYDLLTPTEALSFNQDIDRIVAGVSLHANPWRAEK